MKISCPFYAHLLHVTVIALLVQTGQSQSDAPNVVNQCYRDNSFSFVSLYCGYNKIIHIQVAHHGQHKNANIGHCGELPGDCTQDTTALYDWSKCEGKHSCVQMIKAMDLSRQCGADGGGGVQYLQVEYTCQPISGGSEPDVSTKKTGRRKVLKNRKNGDKNSVDGANSELDQPHDICVNFTSHVEQEIVVSSPGHPTHYMASTDCRCAIQAKASAQVAVTYDDLGLTRRGPNQCVDWLLLQSPGHKDTTAVTCGALPPETSRRTVLSAANWLLMHFHTAGPTGAGGLRTNRPGFRVTIKAVPESAFNIKCYSVHPDVLNSLKRQTARGSEADALVLPATDLEAIAVSAGALSGAAPALAGTGSALLRWAALAAAEMATVALALSRFS